MADTLTATIITALLDDEDTRDGAELALATWAVDRDRRMNFIVDDQLEVQVALCPADTGYGDRIEDEWLKIRVALDADQFGDVGPTAARASAAKLRELADEIDARAAAGGYGREDVA